MNYAEIDAITTEIAAVVKDAIAVATAPLVAGNLELRALNDALVSRITELEAREVPAAFDPSDMEARIEAVSARFDAVPEVNPEELGALRREISEVRASIPEIPAAPDLSGFATKSDIDAVIAALPERQDVSGFLTASDVAGLIPAAPDLSGFATKQDVSEAVSAIPEPPNVPDLSSDLAALRATVEAIRMPDVIHGKDGAGVSDIRQNADGELIVKLTTGETYNAGKVRGDDGFGFDDLTVEDGEREFSLIMSKGDRIERFAVAKSGFIDQGVYKADRPYEKGDAVTWAGSLWIAQRDTVDRPETSDAWRLAVKKGKDGKPGAAAAPRSETVKR